MYAFPRDSAVTGPHYMPGPRCFASDRKPAEAILVVIAIPPDTASSMPSIRVLAPGRLPAGSMGSCGRMPPFRNARFRIRIAL